MLRRINWFWTGAGALLTLFGTNELVAFHRTKVPRWLGGNLALAGEIVAVIVGITIIYTLGIEEEPEGER